MMIDQNQQAPGAAPEQPQQRGTTVCIEPQGDGTFMVYQKDSGGPDKTATDLDDALNQARQMLGGQSTGAQKGQDEAAALIDGFKGARGQVGG